MGGKGSGESKGGIDGYMMKGKFYQTTVWDSQTMEKKGFRLLSKKDPSASVPYKYILLSQPHHPTPQKIERKKERQLT